MIPDVGSTCLFTFTSRFATLNGVYRVRAETTFKDAVRSGVNFVDSLYIPAGLEEKDYNADYLTYTDDKIVVLESVKNAELVYNVPQSVFLNIPDPTIREYAPLTLVVNLGVHRNTQVIYPLLDQIKDLIQSSLGIENALYLLSNPENKVYLTDDDYAALELARKDNIKTLMPLSLQLKQANDKIALQAAMIESYEELIKQQSQD